MSIAALTGDLRPVDLLRDVNLKVNAPLALSALTSEGLYELDLPETNVFTDNALLRGDGGLSGIQDGGWLLDDNDNMLVPGTASLMFADTDTGINALAGELRFRVADTEKFSFNIDDNLEVSLHANLMIFWQQGGANVRFDWGTDDELHFKVGSVAQVTFADALIKPVLDNDVSIGTEALRFEDILSRTINPSHATNPTGVVADIWYNEATKTHRLKADDGIHNIVGATSLTTADDTVSNTTTETLFADKKDIAADSLAIGAAYEWWAWGRETHSGTPIFTFRFRLDAVVVVSGSFTASGSGSGWKLHGHFTVRSIGASGTVQGNSEIGFTTGGSKPVLQVAPVTVDTTQILTAGVSVQMSAASPFNIVILQQFILKKVS